MIYTYIDYTYTYTQFSVQTDCSPVNAIPMLFHCPSRRSLSAIQENIDNIGICIQRTSIRRELLAQACFCGLNTIK